MPRHFALDDDDADRWSKKETNPVVRAIAQRSWYLVIPLIAVWWFHVKTVTPAVKAVDAKIQAGHKAMEEKRGLILKESRDLGVETSRTKAETDTFEVRMKQIGALMDSVRTIENGHLAETHRLETQADSLRQIISASDGRYDQAADSLVRLQAQVDSLRSLIDTHQQATRRLEEELAVDKDLADRLLRPDVYRKNTALLTGQGNFPNRDALPKR